MKANSLTALYDSVFVPVITRMETDFRLQLLDEEQKGLVEQSLTELIDDVGARAHRRPNGSETDSSFIAAAAEPIKVFCLPARASRDELAGAMLAQLLRQAEVEVESAPAKLAVDDIVKLIESAGVDVVCISVVAPSTVMHAQYLDLKLRARLRTERILVGLWGYSDSNSDAIRRVQDSGADDVVTNFAEAVAQIQALRKPCKELIPA